MSDEAKGAGPGEGKYDHPSAGKKPSKSEAAALKEEQEGTLGEPDAKVSINFHPIMQEVREASSQRAEQRDIRIEHWWYHRQIILLGDSAVGKSKLVERYLMDEYNPRQVCEALVRHSCY